MSSATCYTDANCQAASPSTATSPSACPASTLSYKTPASIFCQPMQNCYSSIDCSTAASAVVPTASACPSDAIATKPTNGTICQARYVSCFSAPSCTAASLTGVNFSYTKYNDAALTAEQNWSKCVGAYAIKDSTSSACQFSSPAVVYGVQCYTDSACTQGATWAFSASKCPAADSVAWKQQTWQGLLGACTANTVRCYTGQNCTGSVSLAGSATSCPQGTLSSTVYGSGVCSNSATCYTDTSCAGTGAYGVAPTATTASCGYVTGAVAAIASAPGSTCTVIAPRCYTSGDCSGAFSLGTSSNLTGKTTCPAGSRSFVKGGETTCNKTAACYNTPLCSDTPQYISTSDYNDCKTASADGGPFVAGKSTGSSVCTKVNNACFTSYDCKSTSTTGVVASTIGATSTAACTNDSVAFHTGTGAFGTCQTIIRCYPNEYCSGTDFKLLSGTNPDDCGLTVGNQYLWYKNSAGACVNRVPILYSGDNCSGTRVGAGLKDIYSGGTGSIINYEPGGPGMYMAKPGTTSSQYASYKLGHSGTCKNTAYCYSDLEGKNLLVRAAAADKWTCPPVWNGTKVVAVKGATTAATDALSTATMCSYASNCNASCTTLDCNVAKWYESSNNGAANTCPNSSSAQGYARVLFGTTLQGYTFKCCKIDPNKAGITKWGADCTATTNGYPTVRLDTESLAVPDDMDEAEAEAAETEADFDDEFEADFAGEGVPAAELEASALELSADA